ncbi:universal stress protein [uncultured Dialister sp.]|jgi:nucleotide-binding universal stress UspA family protein|uniref:universal stress protein n=1 Tax=uncultured Dialister sp. TaxID=278064 RepID=UPI002633B417|nr:universal stress protein [uncultured Dialister sp.]
MIDREIHKILIPVDDSKMSDRAFNYGMDMAKLWGAEVHVIYVANAESMSSPDFTIHFNEKNDDTSPLKEKGAAVLARLMERVPEGVKVRQEILMGSPEVMIALTAEDDGADLIIMGSSGRNSFSSMFLGSVSYYTVHHVKCPVLLIK